MPSISDLFGAGEEGEVNDRPFDAANLDRILDEAIAARSPLEGNIEPTAVPDGEAVAGTEGAEPAEPAVPGGIQEPPTPAPSALPETPLPQPAASEDLERLEFVQWQQAMADPDRQLRMRRAMLGVAEPVEAQPPTPSPAPPPAPSLPEHIDPESFEATLWRQNQELTQRLERLTQSVESSQATVAEDRAVTAARNAVAGFSAKYGDRLSQEEIGWVAQTAGAQKLPEAFVSAGIPMDQAMERALDYTLRTNDQLLGKVLGAPPATTPVVQPGETPEADARKRQLTALSSAASPSGEAPQRVPIEHREDGRLSEKSRLALAAEMANRGAQAELMGPN